MNYKKIYDNLISRAKNRQLNEYFEKHHIIPRCMGGDDSKDNLVELTAREHYICHQLLTKIYPDNRRLICAMFYMTVHPTGSRMNNRVYEWIRIKHAAAMQVLQGGKNNSQYGTRWVHHPELKISKKIAKNKDLDIGWFEGRRIDFNLQEKIIEQKSKRRNEILVKQQVEKELKKAEFYKIYCQFVESGYSSIRKYQKDTDCKYSHVTLTKWFKQF